VIRIQRVHRNFSTRFPSSVLREEITPTGSIIYEDFYEDPIDLAPFIRSRQPSLVSDTYLPSIPETAVSYIEPSYPIPYFPDTVISSVHQPISVVEEIERLPPVSTSIQTVQTIRTVVPVRKRVMTTVPVTHTVVKTVPMVQTIVTKTDPRIEVADEVVVADGAVDPRLEWDAADGVIDGTYYGNPIM
jgi:hypothetical protein